VQPLPFEPDEMNASEIGCVGELDTTVGSIVHEMGDALGLWHEHSRSDRQDYVEIHSENVKDAPQFEQPIHSAVDLGPYDLQSIMHYPSLAFSTNNRPTSTARNGQPIGQRDGLSVGDIAAVRSLYPQLPWE
jgi:Astacin (Peptidase family M12A)